MYNRGGECLLRGTDWVLTLNREVSSLNGWHRPVGRSLLKFIESNVNWKTDVWHCCGTLQGNYSSEQQPSRPMHWWARFMALSIRRAWQVTWPFFFSEIRTLGLCKTAERVRDWSQEKEITSRKIGWTDWPRNVVIFGKVSTWECTVGGRRQVRVFN